MFLVSDTQTSRHARIKQFSGNEASIGALLATIDFEWTLRRAILACGTSPNVTIRETVLKRCSGLDRYKEAWKKEVQPRFSILLPAVLSNWKYLKDQAFPFRHKIVHGIKGASGEQFSNDRRDALLQASCELVNFAAGHSIDLYVRLPVRKKKSNK